jgi:hypothetical protein
MLRDNAAHEEPPQSATGPKRRWGIRQGHLESATLAEAHARLTKIAAELRLHMKVEHSLNLPT